MTLKISIPVLLKSREEFLWHDDVYHVDSTCDKVVQFINAKFIECGIFTQKIHRQAVLEVLKNSYDSYAETDLNSSSVLEIDIKISEKYGKIIVRVRDNGLGYPHKEKGLLFQHDKPCISHKQREKYHGHSGIGLYSVHKYYQGEFFLKNRKNQGCSVYLFFNRNTLDEIGLIFTTTWNFLKNFVCSAP